MDIQEARINMLKQQIHTWEVLDGQVLQILATTPREDFVPATYRKLAFADMNIPLEHEQQMFTPKEEARLLQAVALRETDTVLEIGTGSGYVTALLAKMARHVFSVDIFREFIVQAQQKLTTHNINNVTLVNVDAALGWHEQAPYDVVVITGSLPFIPNSFQEDLKVGGRLFAVVGAEPAMTAMLITRTNRRDWEKKSLYETVTPTLINARQFDSFKF